MTIINKDGNEIEITEETTNEEEEERTVPLYVPVDLVPWEGLDIRDMKRGEKIVLSQRNMPSVGVLMVYNSEKEAQHYHPDADIVEIEGVAKYVEEITRE